MNENRISFLAFIYQAMRNFITGRTSPGTFANIEYKGRFFDTTMTRREAIEDMSTGEMRFVFYYSTQPGECDAENGSE